MSKRIQARQTSGGSRGVLRPIEVAGYAGRAGFSYAKGTAHLGGDYSQVAVALAIAWAESGLNPNAVNPTSGATGLWQIHGPGQPRSGTPALKDPYRNALAARAKYAAQGWGAWSVYTNGSYRGHLAASQSVVQGGKGTAEPQGADFGIGGILGDAAGGILGQIVPVLKVAAGGAGLLFTLGLLIYLTGQKALSGPLNAAAAALPPGASQAAKVALRGGSGRVAEREGIAQAKASARGAIREDRRQGGRERVTTAATSRGTRVRVTSRRDAREARAQAEGYYSASARRSRQRSRLKALRAGGPRKVGRAPWAA